MTNRYGIDELHIPFAVNVHDLSAEQTSQLMDDLEAKVGAKYFRTKDLCEEVMAGHRAKAAEPRNFLYGPYLHVFIRPNGERGLVSNEKTEGGMTVYGYDQISTILEMERFSMQQLQYFDRQMQPEGFREKLIERGLDDDKALQVWQFFRERPFSGVCRVYLKFSQDKAVCGVLEGMVADFVRDHWDRPARQASAADRATAPKVAGPRH